MDSNIIGVDLGGTRVRAARFDTDLNLLERVETLTLAHEGREASLERVMSQIAAVWPEDGAGTVAGVGVSAPGAVNPAKGLVVALPNVPGWNNLPFQQLVEARFDRPTWLQNDASCAVLAEIARGAAQGYRHVVYLTVSTGIGGGIISHGRLISGAQGMAGEVGHTIIAPTAGMSGSVEKLAAGPAIAREAVLRLQAGVESVISDMVEGDLSRVTAKVVGQAAAAGDALGKQLIAWSGRHVGVLVANLMLTFNPEIFIIGGGVSNTGDLLLEPIRETVRELTMDASYWRDVPIVRASLGEDVALIGAAALVQMADMTLG